MINKVATTHCSFLRLQIKREDISTNAVSVTKTELYTILRDVCIVSRDVCIVSNRLTCIDSKLSEMEILAQPLSLPFIIENLTGDGISYASHVKNPNPLKARATTFYDPVHNALDKEAQCAWKKGEGSHWPSIYIQKPFMTL
jgi:hypothetical protein